MGDGRVRYARNGDVHLAYRIFGDSGPVLIWTPGWLVNNVDTIGEPDSPYARFIDLVTQSMQFVMFDRRGTGLSDPTAHLLSLDERVDDLRAVIDAVGVERPVLLGSSEGGCISAISALLSARYPERVSFLGLYGTAARFSRDLPDFPWGFTSAEVEAQIDEIGRAWGDGALCELFHGDAANVAGVRQMFGRLQRSIASPSMAKLGWQAFMEIDLRSALGAVRAPTLVLARLACSRFSTRRRGRRGRRGVHSNSCPRSPRGQFPSARASTPANANAVVRNGVAWPCTWVPGSVRWQELVRC